MTTKKSKAPEMEQQEVVVQAQSLYFRGEKYRLPQGSTAREWLAKAGRHVGDGLGPRRNSIKNFVAYLEPLASAELADAEAILASVEEHASSEWLLLPAGDQLRFFSEEEV
jgi:hypothetical protein